VKNSVKSGIICFFLESLIFKSARLSVTSASKTLFTTSESSQSSTIEIFFIQIISTTDKKMKFKLDFSFIAFIASSNSFFLPRAYHGFVVSSVPTQILWPFISNSL
jgi:hypothetical protein